MIYHQILKLKNIEINELINSHDNIDSFYNNFVILKNRFIDQKKLKPLIQQLVNLT